MKILVISPHFPTPDIYSDLANDPRSKFLLRYIECWAGNEHSVTVVHTPPKYPYIFRRFVSYFKKYKWFRKYKLSRFVQNDKSLGDKIYTYNNIKIVRKSILKIVPNSNYSPLQIKGTLRFIKENVELSSFDVVVCDYLSPSLQIVDGLKLCESVTIFSIIHQTDLSYYDKHSRYYDEYLCKVNSLLFRSENLMESFSARRNIGDNGFLMLSGVPDKIKFGEVRSKIQKLIYVGTLRKSKNIDIVLYAYSRLIKKLQIPLQLDIIGDGEYASELIELSNSLGLSDSVEFHGRLNHEDVFDRMRRADLFVMVSRETFGMVYVEAMSQGCIVIGARGEGIDGVVIDKKNGFLSTIDDIEDLEQVLTSILSKSSEELMVISSSAIETSRKLTDSFLAEELLAHIQRVNDSE